MKVLGMIIWTFVLLMSAGGQAKEALKPRYDSLLISIQGVPESEMGRINNHYSVSADGMVAMWIIGPIQANGKTCDQLGKFIEAAYRKAKIYDNPRIKVSRPPPADITYPRALRVTGAVLKPGKVLWEEGHTLIQAIKMAGGVNAIADKSHVRLYRKGTVSRYDLDKKEHREVWVYPRDEVIVQRRMPRKNPAQKGSPKE